MTDILTSLQNLQDPAFRRFHAKLIPTVDPETVMGVRTPELRKLAKQLSGSPEAAAFMLDLPHTYYEENCLHGLLIAELRSFDACIAALDAFLPQVDNWATCDMLCPKCFAKHKQELLPHIHRWLESEHPYTVRFAMEMLMVHYLKEDYRPEYPALVAGIRSQEYYVNMMIAWYFATALAFQWDSVIGYLEQRKLSPWVHGKTIQKAIESYRITPEQKAYLKTLK